ncbi:hypothetical protein [Nocardia amamiensis]|uniref:hypothetical protein n=1 Tax=Nocardia amamiensis TaxID=404578 RepID=UPI00082DAD94|nr:hypothetical protein [Nocardia amamiensis]
MAREENSRYPMPASIVLVATQDGWRHSILTTQGGMLCGRLARVAADATPERARAAAVTMLRAVAREFHDTGIEVTWKRAECTNSWTGQVVPARRTNSPT